ncbi:MAG TPA: ATP-binding protein, partial [Spirochaetia bacterium]|nr:ATP-binding protein [Spirochaetia bacterium]
YRDLEVRQMGRSVDLVTTDIAQELRRIESTGQDWAYWDETARFVDGRNPTFEKVNLADSALSGLDLGFIIFADTRGRVVLAKVINQRTGQAIPASRSFVEEATEGGALLRPMSGTGIAGVIKVGSRAALIDALPILNSRRELPSHGVLLLGTIIDDREVTGISGRVRFPIEAVPQSDPSVRSLFGRSPPSPPGARELVVRPIDGRTVAGYTPIRDLQGGVGLILRITASREIYAEGVRAALYSTLALVVMGLVTFGVIHLLLGTLILQRLSRITAFMGLLGTGGPLMLRLGTGGRDELAQLSRAVDGLLDTVQKTTDDLREATAQAVVANRVKTEFLANMSHELRTPLNHIIGFTELVADGTAGPVSATQREYLGDVLDSSRHLLSIINDILDLSKVESGKLELQPARIAVRGLVESSMRMVTEKASKHGVELSLDLSEAPQEVVADERALKQVLFNLLSNGVKFTPDGGQLRVQVRRCPPASGSGARVEFAVTDTGIGIPPDDLKRLFAPYTRGQASAAAGYEGTGLGLALSKRLVELHGGRIWAESEGPGLGSSFRFVLPLERRQALAVEMSVRR